jgi:hypothetical protein
MVTRGDSGRTLVEGPTLMEDALLRSVDDEPAEVLES